MRLKQLYPEPSTVYSLGKVVQPVGLKPDIHLRHADGREWAFEMVHGNSHAAHLLENHRRYAEHGVSDTWILWDSLRPKAGPERPLEQGFLPSLLSESKVYPLTATQRAILDMQSGPVRILCAFTLSDDLLPPDASEFTRAMFVGLDRYTFSGWQGEETFAAVYDFVPLTELTFSETGAPTTPTYEPDSEMVVRQTLQRMGIDLTSGVIPSEALQQLNQSLSTDGGWQVLMGGALVLGMLSLSPDEQQEVLAFIQSGGFQNLPPFVSELANVEPQAAMNDPAMMDRIAAEAPRLREYVIGLDLPAVVKKLMLSSLKETAVTEAADAMRWRRESEAAQRTRDSLA